MTQQQLIQEFSSYPKVVKSLVIRELLQIFEKDLEEIEAKEITNEEKYLAYQRLRGIAKIEGKTPPTGCN